MKSFSTLRIWFMFGLYDIWFQLVCEQECYSDTWFMVVPVANIPGLVHDLGQPTGLKNCFEPRQS